MDAGQRWQVLRLHVEDRIPLTTLSRDCGIGERTLQRWHARYRAGGYAALGDRHRADRGRRRTDPELVQLVERVALTRPRPTAATIHRAVLEHCAATGTPAPSYSTVRSVIAGLDPGMVTLALEGPASYRNRHELALRRRADRPNALWQADHTMLDIHVRDQRGDPVRPWLTIVLDDHSRAVCGYLLATGAPSAANTALALRQAIWPKTEPDWPQCGVPNALYTDHGSDFTSHRIGDTLAALHVRVIHSAVGRPQGRGKIERFFGTVNTELLARLPGHIAPRRPPAPTLTLTELDAALTTWLRTYNARPHRELRQPPNTAWAADGWLPSLPDTLEELDGLLMTVPTSRVVQRDGIHFQGLRYTATTLAPYVGAAVTIRYDPRDITEVRVFHQDAFLCTAIDVEHSRQTISLRDIQAARTAHRRRLREQIRERVTVAPLGADRSPGGEEPAASRPGPRPKLRTYQEG
ncbi:Mu transposase C-terminal domain-containing protein [Modestobacter sp. Leaf380]|uniref:Mu transposase C-terminal domain-containing protein n=1 Tax=Modestobacter sp. Leaf380 TaxID=1736356 RepID=UPI0006F2991F|nr:Mu transposase C-terminal domain-containing protein [Modestobacter sp. Leaf380]KQS66657.1 transposase [Modestobacter sp. Leaf380]